MRSLSPREWPVWEEDVSQFEWHYDERETCYMPEVRVRVEPTDGGAPVELGPGDIVTFPEGLDCTWKVQRPVGEHHRFGRHGREVTDRSGRGRHHHKYGFSIADDNNPHMFIYLIWLYPIPWINPY